MSKEKKPANLEDMIRAAAANGELTYLSVCAVAGKGPGNISWSAAYSPASKWANGMCTHVDPIEAMKGAMVDKRLGNLVKSLEKTIATAPPGMLAAAIEKVGEPALTPTVDDSDFA